MKKAPLDSERGGADGQSRHLNDENVPLVIKAHRAVLERLALNPPTWPFRPFDGPRGFGTYWRDNDMRGSWQARRDCIEQILGPTRDALEELQERVRAPLHPGAVGQLQESDLRRRRGEAADCTAGRREQRRGDRPPRRRLSGVHRSSAAARADLAADGRLVDGEPPAEDGRENCGGEPVPASVPVTGLRTRAAGDADLLRPLRGGRRFRPARADPPGLPPLRPLHPQERQAVRGRCSGSGWTSTGRSSPPPGTHCEAFLRGCGVTGQRTLAQWQKAWRRTSTGPVTVPHGAQQPVRTTEQLRRVLQATPGGGSALDHRTHHILPLPVRDPQPDTAFADLYRELMGPARRNGLASDTGGDAILVSGGGSVQLVQIKSYAARPSRSNGRGKPPQGRAPRRAAEGWQEPRRVHRPDGGHGA